MSKVKLENNKKKVLNDFNEQCEVGLYKMGLLWLSNVTEIITSRYSNARGGNGIVDTGRLRASMSFITSQFSDKNKSVKESNSKDYVKGKANDNQLIVGTNVEYGNYIESGTSKQKARPFLKPSLLENTKDYEKIFKDSIQK